MPRKKRKKKGRSRPQHAAAAPKKRDIRFPPLSPDQQQAVDVIMGNPGPFFLTGAAGSGKSFVIEYLYQTVKKCVVTATTGVAAQRIGGRTLHSFASIHPNYGAVQSARANARVANCDLLIVDEISMANNELMAQLSYRFRQAGHTPKLLLVGDFLQLPPVDGVPLFKGYMWPKYQKITLTTQHRQQDDDFISILGDVRRGLMTDRVRAFIEARRVPALPDDCTHLMAYRNEVEARNLHRLSQLPGNAGVSLWDVRMLSEKEVNLQNTRFLAELRIKVGARVVLLTNTPQWVNGSTGEVVSIEPGVVRVKLDSGGVVSVQKDEEEVLDADGKAACKIVQYPMMLAWSMTIHKSQGMTIDRIGVNLSGHFAAGQTYVALSRCRTAEGLFLVGDIQDFVVDPETLSMFASDQPQPGVVPESGLSVGQEPPPGGPQGPGAILA